MKKNPFLVFVFIQLFSCGSKNIVKPSQQLINTKDSTIHSANFQIPPDSFRVSFLPDSIHKIPGDFNGDGNIDTAKVLPAWSYDSTSWICPYAYTTIIFGEPMDSIVIDGMPDAYIMNVGDLDGNGSDELQIIPEWYNSCWGGVVIYAYQKNKWAEIASTGNIYRCNERNRVRKIKNGVFLIITDSIDIELGDHVDVPITFDIRKR